MQTAVLFDLDGVLIDTEGQYSEFWREIGKIYLPENSDFAGQIKGKTLVQIYQQYFFDKTDEQKDITQALDEFERQMKFPFIPGAMKFVASLREKGFKIAVVTSSNRDKMRSLFNEHSGLSDSFDRIFTAEDTARSKPFPDCYISAARHLGFEASECYVFEDSLSGLQAGRDSGATVIGLATTYDAERIAPFCHHTIENFTNYTVAAMCSLKK